MIELDKESLILYDENNYTLDSTDNIRMYNNFYYGVNCNKSNVVTKIGIRYTVTGTNILLMATGGASGLHDTCYVIDQDNLIICVSDSIFSINIIDLSPNWVIQGDSASCIQLFKTNDIYIVHGELGVSAITSSGEILWCFRGRDIFVTPDGRYKFQIVDNKIYLTDWERNEYVLDLEGNLIN
ncbi:hypothetical protein R9X47_28685 [Wukongibacter baidiensis]|uniref:hypothetical protein n=1 Tax=Wukongibacter baidiensis TaxID=1723361 RepID=UPI003D7FC233